ncbi:MAG: hypothetical protein K2L55_04160 [Muribaculaceae bacterium]|nr:hypothetical protein [Muribaculaceae bacterium]
MKRTFIILSFILFAMSIVAEARFWTKKELLNAGFKFGVQPHYSEVLYGKKIDGKLNGIVWLKSTDNITIGYMTNGEMAAPYLTIFGEYNYTSIQEKDVSYNSKGRGPIKLITDEIFGFDTSSDAIRNRIKNETFNIKRVVDSFDDFMFAKQKIPTRAWAEPEYTTDIRIVNSDVTESIPVFRKNLTYPDLVLCDGVWRHDSEYVNGNGAVHINLPSDFDMRQFTVDLDFKPMDLGQKCTLINLSNLLGLSIKDNKVEAATNLYRKVIWNTDCPVKIGAWNHISIICDIDVIIIQVNDCSKLAPLAILRKPWENKHFISSFAGTSNFKGEIKNIRITYN